MGGPPRSPYRTSRIGWSTRAVRRALIGPEPAVWAWPVKVVPGARHPQHERGKSSEQQHQLAQRTRGADATNKHLHESHGAKATFPQRRDLLGGGGRECDPYASPPSPTTPTPSGKLLYDSRISLRLKILPYIFF